MVVTPEGGLGCDWKDIRVFWGCWPGLGYIDVSLIITL